MPLPVGHTLAGYGGYVLLNHTPWPQWQKFRERFWGSILLANLPDIDFLPGIVMGQPTLFHRQATHSLTLAILVGLVGYWLAPRLRLRRATAVLWTAGLYMSHILLDMLVADKTPPGGVQVLWPLSQNYWISPFTPFPGLDSLDSNASLLRSLVSGQCLFVVLCEAALLAPWVLGAIAWVRDRRDSRDAAQRR